MKPLDCKTMLERAKQNYQRGVFEWLPVSGHVALNFLNCVPPIDHNGSSFATGEPYTHDSEGGVYLCFRNLIITGLREEPVNAVVCVLQAVPDETEVAYACYMNRRQFREALKTPVDAIRPG